MNQQQLDDIKEGINQFIAKRNDPYEVQVRAGYLAAKTRALITEVERLQAESEALKAEVARLQAESDAWRGVSKLT